LLSVFSIYWISPVSISLKIFLISSLFSTPKAFNIVVAGTFLRRSIFAFIVPSFSVINSNQAPLLGIIEPLTKLFLVWCKVTAK